MRTTPPTVMGRCNRRACGQSRSREKNHNGFDDLVHITPATFCLTCFAGARLPLTESQATLHIKPDKVFSPSRSVALLPQGRDFAAHGFMQNKKCPFCLVQQTFLSSLDDARSTFASYFPTTVRRTKLARRRRTQFVRITDTITEIGCRFPGALSSNTGHRYNWEHEKHVAHGKALPSADDRLRNCCRHDVLPFL